MRLIPSTLFLSAVLAAAGTTTAQEARKAELDRTSLSPAAQQLEQTVRDAVRTAGGDLERMQAHWVLAFSTGHYKADPLGAQAARELATQFLQRVAVSGDQVTARAWEMDLWTYRNETGLTQAVGNDVSGDLSQIGKLWPTTPAVGSVGGHDTERAAVSLTRAFAKQPDTVIVLLTNTAASVGAAGTRLLGANAPEYQDALGTWTRVNGTQDGATLNVPYVVKAPAGNIQGQMQAVVFVPKTFTGAALSQPRSERATSPAAAPTGGANPAGLLIGLLVVGAVAFGAWKFLGHSGGGRGRGALRVGDSSFNVADMPSGRPFCVIAGAGYTPEGDTPVVPVAGLPAAPVAEISRVGREYRVRSVNEDVRLSSVGGRVVAGDTATLSLKPEAPDATLEFTGEVRGAGGVPKDITRSVTVALDGDS